MEYKQLVAYSLSSIGFITLIHHLFKLLRHKQLLKSYFRNKVVLITGASSGLGMFFFYSCCKVLNFKCFLIYVQVLQ